MAGSSTSPLQSAGVGAVSVGHESQRTGQLALSSGTVQKVAGTLQIDGSSTSPLHDFTVVVVMVVTVVVVVAVTVVGTVVVVGVVDVVTPHEPHIAGQALLRNTLRRPAQSAGVYLTPQTDASSTGSPVSKHTFGHVVVVELDSSQIPHAEGHASATSENLQSPARSSSVAAFSTSLQVLLTSSGSPLQ